jgi:hypothetical protein
VGVDEFFVEGEDFGFGIGGSLGRELKERKHGCQKQEGEATRSKHEHTS